MSPLTGKKIWIVGASEGIGEAVAKALAQEGAQIAISARSAEKIRHLAAALVGPAHISIPMDVTDEESVQAAWQELMTRWGGIDIVMYNAGAYEPMNAARFDYGKTMKMVDVNFLGALRVLRNVIPLFVSQKSGHIVLVASVAAYRGLPNAIGYGASKAGLLHLAENLRCDLVHQNIKVQVVSPGFVKTRLTEKNEFKMPFLVTPEFAAARMVKGMLSCKFDINFPRRFTYLLKTLRLLPYCIYFKLMKRVNY